DDALKRSGRFGRVVYIGAPDFSARKELFKFYLKDLPIEKKIDFDKLASSTENFAASDIMAICENASSVAFEKAVDTGDEHKIDQSMIMSAIKNERSDITEWFNMVARLLSEEELQELYPDLFNDLNKMKGLKSLSQRDKKMYG
ncbi:hypothetical protein HYT84_01915, partial [Candidatus Micrarchaeota archaeon]|nr:hypothetical protein [Candidatus Micrarchaeota archaeon]